MRIDSVGVKKLNLDITMVCSVMFSRCTTMYSLSKDGCSVIHGLKMALQLGAVAALARTVV